MKKSAVIKTVISVAAVIAILLYFINDIYVNNVIKYNTETAVAAVEQDALKMECFIVRDEQYIDGSLNGTLVPIASDGKRVARGDTVAYACSSEQEAADYASLLRYREIYGIYEKISERSELGTLNMEKLNETINDSYGDILSKTAAGEYTGLSDSIVSFAEKLATKQVLSEGSIDLTEKLEKLEKMIADLEEKQSVDSEILAPFSGYYISVYDGYENIADYDEIENISVSQAEAAMKAEPKNISGKMGKIVASYKWYMVSVIDSKYSKIITEGDRMKVNMPKYGAKDLDVRIESVSDEKDGKIAVVISCNMMNEAFANMRFEEAELVIDEYRGYRIKSSSIRMETAKTGEKVTVVYILRGDVMNIRRAEIIYEEDGYVIVSPRPDNPAGFKNVKLYDEVIVEGRDLKDGKLVS